ncbi:unnamed protein product [Paramecium sonneborni]|uniref:Uncharacterized protein n=1 Tax=Paramecium sonneborni TaxID=65129 RepID=A0A8S1RFX9_9CILI|nr:unnamed protein product [Paramecium sonneborni]
MKTMLTIFNQLLNFFYKFQRKLDFSNRISRIIFKYSQFNFSNRNINKLPYKQQITMLIEILLNHQQKNIAIRFRNNYIPTLNLIQELKIQMINFQFIKQQDFQEIYTQQINHEIKQQIYDHGILRKMLSKFYEKFLHIKLHIQQYFN